MGISDDLHLSLSEDEESDDFVIVDCLIDVNDSMMVDSDSEQLLPTHFHIQEFQISYMDSDTDMDSNFSDGEEVSDGSINPDFIPIGSSDSEMSDLDSESYMDLNDSDGFFIEDFFNPDLNPIESSYSKMPNLDSESYMDLNDSDGFFIDEFFNSDVNPIGSSGSQMRNLDSESYIDLNDFDMFFIDEFFNPDLIPIGRSDSQFLEENVEVGTNLLEQGLGLGFGIEDDSYSYDVIIDDSEGDDNRDGFFEQIQADEFIEFVEFAPIDFDSIRGSLPAAKSIVQNLPTVILKNVICAVCQNEISLEEEAKCLPCTHHYHGECILPWLEIRNTCPVCRFELPTDDPDYEHWRRQRGT